MSDPKSSPDTVSDLIALLQPLDGNASLGALDAQTRSTLGARLRQVAASIDPQVPATHDYDRIAKAYFDYALVGIIETDAQWRITKANQAAANISGRDLGALLGSRFDHLQGREDDHRAQRHLNLLLEQGIGQTEWRLGTAGADGEAPIIEVASIQVSEALFVHVIDDVTSQRTARRSIEQARDAAEQANRVKGEFMARMSHEMRTPLNGILGLSGLLASTPLNDEQRDYARKITKSGQFLLSIINDLLDFAKIEAGQMQLESMDFPLSELIDDLASMSAQLNQDKGLDIAFHVDGSVPVRMKGDRLRLTQCLNNLISNAIKFTHEGNVELSCYAEPDAHGDDQVVFIVSDTGVGIEPDFLKRLFQPFSQADAGISRKFGGSGLGLAITRELVGRMGGGLSVESTPGHGSRFRLSVPCGHPEPAAPPLPVGDQGMALVLGRREATLRNIEYMLTGEGWDAHPHQRRPRQLKFVPDLIVADMAIRNQDRAAWLGWLMQQRLDTPMVIIEGAGLTAADDAALRRRGHFAVLRRPVTPNALRQAIDAARSDTRPDTVISPTDDTPQEFAGRRVMVVEDNAINQLVLGNLLRRGRVDTRLCNGGAEALAMLDTSATPPDLILMDVHMPDVDGLEATRQIRQRGLDVAIIGVSAGASAEEVQRCLDAGMVDFLPKPIDPDELWGCLTRWLPPAGSQGAFGQEAAEQRFLDDAEALARARALFIELHGGDGALLRAQAAEADHRALAMTLHSLKGAAATIGAEALAHRALAFEKMLDDAPRPSDIDARISELEQLLVGQATESAGPD